MSSLPFRLGCPVVDELPCEDGIYVLRARNPENMFDKVDELKCKLCKNDLIRIYPIGYKPDDPIPVCRYFVEVHINIGAAPADGALPYAVGHYRYWTIGKKEVEDR